MTNAVQLLVAEIPEATGRELDIELPILGEGIEVSRWNGRCVDDALLDAVAKADVVLTDFVKFDSKLLQTAKKRALISVAATGWDCIDVEAAANHGVSVCSVEEYCTGEVADHALTLMLAMCRRLLDYDHLVRQQRRWIYDDISGLKRLSEQTLGIIGMGRIGQAVLRRTRAFGLRVLAHDPFMQKQEPALPGVEWCDLDALLRQSDLISLHCNADDSNRHLLDAAAFARMERKPLLINVARGELIDENALVTALDKGQVAGAALDVLATESPQLESHPLAGREDVLLTPHVAFYSDTSVRQVREISAWNIRHHLDGNHEAVRRYVHHAPAGP